MCSTTYSDQAHGSTIAALSAKVYRPLSPAGRGAACWSARALPRPKSALLPLRGRARGSEAYRLHHKPFGACHAGTLRVPRSRMRWTRMSCDPPTPLPGRFASGRGYAPE